MIAKVSTLQVREQLGDLLNRVALRDDQFIIERKGKALAALVPIKKIEAMVKAARLHLLDILDRQHGTLSQEQADQLANEAKHKSRRN